MARSSTATDVKSQPLGVRGQEESLLTRDARLRGARALTGGVLALLGGAVLVAWACGARVLIQVHPQFHPLHYNGALALVVWGGGLVAVAAARFRIAQAAGGALTLARGLLA